MDENEISEIIVDQAFKIHTKLGPGLLESVYEMILAKELEKCSLEVECQKAIPIKYDGLEFDQGFRADIIVNNKVIIELKSVEKSKPVHYKQLLTYLKLTHCKLGMLINFGELFIKTGIRRIVNKLPSN